MHGSHGAAASDPWLDIHSQASPRLAQPVGFARLHGTLFCCMIAADFCWCESASVKPISFKMLRKPLLSLGGTELALDSGESIKRLVLNR